MRRHAQVGRLRLRLYDTNGLNRERSALPNEVREVRDDPYLGRPLPEASPKRKATSTMRLTLSLTKSKLARLPTDKFKGSDHALSCHCDGLGSCAVRGSQGTNSTVNSTLRQLHNFWQALPQMFRGQGKRPFIVYYVPRLSSGL